MPSKIQTDATVGMEASLMHQLLCLRYAELLEEWQSGRQSQMCEGGKWEDEYTKMHDEVKHSHASNFGP